MTRLRPRSVSSADGDLAILYTGVRKHPQQIIHALGKVIYLPTEIDRREQNTSQVEGRERDSG